MSRRPAAESSCWQWALPGSKPALHAPRRFDHSSPPCLPLYPAPSHHRPPPQRTMSRCSTAAACRRAGAARMSAGSGLGCLQCTSSRPVPTDSVWQLASSPRGLSILRQISGLPRVMASLKYSTTRLTIWLGSREKEDRWRAEFRGREEAQRRALSGSAGANPAAAPPNPKPLRPRAWAPTERRSRPALQGRQGVPWRCAAGRGWRPGRWSRCCRPP